jgi:hypothetical protein
LTNRLAADAVPNDCVHDLGFLHARLTRECRVRDWYEDLLGTALKPTLLELEYKLTPEVLLLPRLSVHGFSELSLRLGNLLYLSGKGVEPPDSLIGLGKECIAECG